MRVRHEAPPGGRIDYRWPVDHTDGFEKSSLFYDHEGRLIAVDYEAAPSSPRRPEQPSPASAPRTTRA